MSKLPDIDQSWLDVLKDEFEKQYYKDIKKAIIQDLKTSAVIYPPLDLVFNAFKKTPFDKIKAVIIGQDPYHGPGQAHGLCFSVPDGVPIPPSLLNIFKELNADLGIPIPKSGNLEKWANQGVLLLNAIMTVRANSPASHSKIGWERFTDFVIKTISDRLENIVFMLWGNFAKSKSLLIDTKKHFVIQSAHPSPFSASNGFFGSRPFSKGNDYLKSVGKQPIDWSL